MNKNQYQFPKERRDHIISKMTSVARAKSESGKICAKPVSPAMVCPAEARSNIQIEIGEAQNPVQRAIELLRFCEYGEAHSVLVEAYQQNRRRIELAQIANLIFPCGMIMEAIAGLHRLSDGIEDYGRTRPLDEAIGLAVSM